MNGLIVVLVAGILLFWSCPALHECMASPPVKSEENSIRALELAHKTQLDARYAEYLPSAKATIDIREIDLKYRKLLSYCKVNIEIAELEIEARPAPSEDEATSYDIKVYYVDPTAKGCNERLFYIAMWGAVLARNFERAQIGAITAIPVFPGHGKIGKDRARGMTEISYPLHERKDLFSRIADGNMRKDDLYEMSSWLREWKATRLDPNYVAGVRRGFWLLRHF